MDLLSLEKLLGRDVFFVPCEWGTKKPLVTYVERPFDSTKTEAYRAVFEVLEVNVAVYLGKASGGLCAIDFDRDEDLAAFLRVNPRLSSTTQSRGSRGGMIWVRIGRNPKVECRMPKEARNPNPEKQQVDQSLLEADYPESCTTKHFEWRADKRLS